MTKEELKQEAKKSCIDKTHYCIGGFGGNAYCEGYIDSAKSREKRITKLEKENAKLKKQLEDVDNATDCFNRQEEIIAQAKAIINIALCALRHQNIVCGKEKPFEKQAELEFNLFIEQAEQFIKE